jgi:hypothetical protein
MRRLTYAVIATAVLPVLACSPSGYEFQNSSSDRQATEPKRRGFNGVSKLTPDARTLLSQKISGFGGRKSVFDMKIEIVRSLLRDDLNGNGLSQSDLIDTIRQRDTGVRLQNIMQIFRSDYDGDAIVTKAEFDKTVEIERLRRKKQMDDIRAPYSENPRSDQHDDAAILRALTMFRNADLNGDSKIALEEAYKAPSEINRGQPRYQEISQKAAFALDFNNDGLVTREEIEAGIDLFVAEAKQAGVIFPDVSEQPDAYHPRTPNSLSANCDLSKPSAKAKIIRLSAYEGNQLSNVSLAGQDNETTTSEVKIEPGSEPLYIVASSYEAQIWRFTGAVSRVEHIVLSSWQKNEFGQPAVGLAGIPRAKMSSTTPECVGGYYERIDLNALERQLGRKPNDVAAFYGIDGISLPSKLQYKLASTRPAYLASNRSDVQQAWNEFTRFSPAGVHHFELEDIVSRGKAERYGVLPHQAGLVQLLISGAVQKSDQGYTVRKAMRFPGSMGGAHSTTFIVPSGVPVPSGSRSHNCVKIYGKTEEGPRCRIG